MSGMDTAVKLAQALQIYTNKGLQKTSIFESNVNALLTKSGLREGSFDLRFPVVFSFHGLDVKHSLDAAVNSKDITKNAANYAKQAMYDAMARLSNSYEVLTVEKWHEIEAALQNFSNTIIEGSSELERAKGSKYIDTVTKSILEDMHIKYNTLRNIFNKAYIVSYTNDGDGREPSVRILANSFSNFRNSINRVIKQEIDSTLKLNKVTNSKLTDPTYITHKILNWGHTRTGTSIISGKLIASLISIRNVNPSTEVMQLLTKDFIKETGQESTNIKLHAGNLTKGDPNVLSLVISSNLLQKVISQNRSYNQAALGQQEAKWNILEAINRNPELKKLLGVSNSQELLDKLIRMRSSPNSLERIHTAVTSPLTKDEKGTGAFSKKILDVKTPIKQLVRNVSVKLKPGVGKRPHSKQVTGRGSAHPIVDLEAILRARINEQVAQNMGSGSDKRILNYRTGRFSESVNIKRLSESRAGMVSVFYNYMKNPYATFSEGGKQQYPKTRDPKLLISRSIRDIAGPLISNRLRSVVV